MRTILGVGNCQVQAMVQCAAPALGLTPHYIRPAKTTSDPAQFLAALTRAEIVVAQREPFADEIREMVRGGKRANLPILPAPRLFFTGFHPDVATSVKSAVKNPLLPLGTANSAILLQSWQQGLDPAEALTLFRHEVFDALGYYDAYPLALHKLLLECGRSGLNMAPYVESWRQSGPFFYLPLHPKIEVLNDIAFELLRNAGLWRGAAPAAPRDRLAHHAIWPVYPEIGERIGLPGDYRFWPRTSPEDHGAERVPLGLPEFIERTFAAYGQQAPAPSSFPRLEDERLQSITSLARTVEPNATDETEIADWMDAEDEIAANIICDEELLDDGSD